MTRQAPLDAACERFVHHAIAGERHAARLALTQAVAWGVATPEHRAGLQRWVAEQVTAPCHSTPLTSPLDAVSAPELPLIRSEVMK